MEIYVIEEADTELSIGFAFSLFPHFFPTLSHGNSYIFYEVANS